MKSLTIGNLEIPVPIIQGGMGIGISLSGLASAVANMGGIGVISTVGIGFLNCDKPANYRKNHIRMIRQEIQAARKRSKGILGVNVMSVITNYADTIRTVLEEGIDIIFSGAGLPLDLPGYLGENQKTKLIPIVSSARAANIICQKWSQNYNYLPDAFVVEGPKAGGHLGFKAGELNTETNKLENLISDVIEVTKRYVAEFKKEIPVIAAGGIYSGNDIFRIMKKGASAVQMGTRFVATEECDASDEFKRAFIQASAEDIRIIKSPVGLPGRTIYNNFLQEVDEGKREPVRCKYHCIRSCDPRTTSYCIADALINASKGNLNDGFAFTGSNVGMVTQITSVETVFTELKAEYDQSEELEYQNNEALVTCE